MENTGAGGGRGSALQVGQAKCRRVRCPKGEKGVVMGQMRRALSVVAVRAQAGLLLDRMQYVGQGAAMAAKRRHHTEWVCRQMDLRRRREWAGDRGSSFGWKTGRFKEDQAAQLPLAAVPPLLTALKLINELEFRV